MQSAITLMYMEQYELFIDGHSLTIENIAEVALNSEIKVKMSDEAKQRVQKSRDFIDKLVAKEEVVYGLTTGFGSFKNKHIDKEKTEELQINLIRSHVIGTGAPFFLPEVRAAILIRANSLAKGYSGVRPIVIEKLLEILNKDIYPFVPEQGSVGASGDLAPLSHLILVLMGEGEIIEDGKRIATEEILQKYNFEPIKKIEFCIKI